jgi:hypothetical protein
MMRRHAVPSLPSALPGVTIMRFVLNGQFMELRRDVVLARPREPVRDDDVVYPVQQAFEVASGYVSGSVHQPHGASAPAHPRIRHCPLVKTGVLELNADTRGFLGRSPVRIPTSDT